MIKITRDYVNDHMNRDLVPAAVCKSGETVVFETRDCYDDCVVSEERPLGERPDGLGNPATGPLYVEEAEEGDTLKIEILDITLRSYGVMRSAVDCGAFAGTYDKIEAKIFDLSQEDIPFDEHLMLKQAPMIGVIGTAPAKGSIPNSTPGEHGGNMDCTQIKKGSILYLPVEVRGALLSMGDLHALMADGEVFICGMETAGEVTVRVSVIKGRPVPTPFLVKDDRMMTIQSAQTLDEASGLASYAMLNWLQQMLPMNAMRIGMLLSLIGNLVICQIVDPLKTVRMELPLTVLEVYGCKLP